MSEQNLRTEIEKLVKEIDERIKQIYESGDVMGTLQRLAYQHCSMELQKILSDCEVNDG